MQNSEDLHLMSGDVGLTGKDSLDSRPGRRRFESSDIPALEQFKVGGIVFHHRPDTLDEWIIREVLNPLTYLRPLHLQSEDVVLDLGMNIGAFAVYACRVASMVIGVEPEPENFAIAQLNLDSNKFHSYLLYQAAVVGGEEKKTRLWVNRKRNRGNHSLIRRQGRESIEVEAISARELITEHRPTKIKMDIEGAEAEVVETMDFKGVQTIAIEYHRRALKDQSNEIYEGICTLLAGAFDWVKAPPMPRGWRSMIYAKKGKPFRKI